MSHQIRKISIGQNYKDNAMHYHVGQEVYDGHSIECIIEEATDFLIYISKRGESKLWKSFNKNMAISVEYDINFQ